MRLDLTWRLRPSGPPAWVSDAYASPWMLFESVAAMCGFDGGAGAGTGWGVAAEPW